MALCATHVDTPCACRYAALTVACTKLLHCVWVPGTASHRRFLFVRGTVECEYLGWQLPLVAAVAALVAIPLLLPFAARWSLAPPGARAAVAGAGCAATSPGAGSVPVSQQWRLAVRLALVESYHRQWYWWESALMAQRLVLALLYTFLSAAPGSQALLLGTLCAVFCTVHHACRPMRSPQAQTLQGALLMCLSVRALVGAFQEGIALEGGDTAPAGVHPLMLVFSVVLPLVAITWAFLAHRVGPVAAWGRAHARRCGWGRRRHLAME